MAKPKILLSILFVSQSPAILNEVIYLQKIACFTGHREIYKEDRETIKQKLTDAIIRLINDGYTEFRAGGALGFDMLAESCVLELKKEYPQISLVIYAPCLDQSKYFSEREKKEYMRLIEAADKRLCLSKTYYEGCMLDRNRAMVDGCNVCIAYKRKNTGGTAYTVRYAKGQDVTIIEI